MTCFDKKCCRLVIEYTNVHKNRFNFYQYQRTNFETYLSIYELDQIEKIYNGYLLYGKRLKREICFRRNEILFYAEIQQKFTYLTSEASSIIEFELNFGIIKNFIESKKFHVEDCFSIQHATFCHSNQHCGTSLSVFTQKPAKNPAKSG